VLCEQPVAQQPLHGARSREPQRLGKPDDGGGLDRRAVGDDGERLERQVIRMVEHVARYLLQPATE